MEEIKQAIKTAVKDVFNEDIEPELTRPDEQFGDYATNVALQLAGNLGKNPREVAETLASKLQTSLIQKTEVAGPGFLNITLTDEALIQLLHIEPTKPYSGKVVVAEYSDPNPFKVLHAGHLYTSIVGDSIANLLEYAGAEVHRVNYGGDVGLHVGKTMWAILKKLNGEHPEKLEEIKPAERSEWMASAYVEGTNAYEDDENAKQEITALNKRVYELFAQNDHDSNFAKIYWITRQWSYDYFDEFYDRIGSTFERYYPESEVADLGLKIVHQQLEKGVFQTSDGAIIFDGEKYGLHTRVFINSEGIPTYETKEVGLIFHKKEDYNFDTSVVITGNEQEQYMQVVLKAIEQFEPGLVQATRHLTHGLVKLQGGQKMSSRKGNILRAVDVLDATTDASKKIVGNEDQSAVLGAVKYTFLKHRTGADIIYDPEESVSMLGNSGPYLQYSHARARSILSKKEVQKAEPHFEPDERSLVRKITEYPEALERAVNELMPHHVCTYLYELAQNFNRFYEKNHVLDDPRENIRLNIVEGYAETLKNGLMLLGIPAPEKM